MQFSYFSTSEEGSQNHYGSRPRDSCRELLKHLRILPLQSQYMLSLLLFIVDNKNLFHVNSEIYSINTRQNFTFISLRLT